jgi:hypothetical protein
VADARDDLVPATPADLIVLDALWSGVVNDWESEERHLKALEHAQKNGLLMELARRYGTLKDDADRAVAAKKRLDAIAMVATSELFATRTDRGRRAVPTWLWALGVAVCAALLAIAFFWGWGARK